jgi:hypothetical protein
MGRMDERSVLDALRTVVPVWAVQALVADTEDWLLIVREVCFLTMDIGTDLVTAITKSSVLGVAAGSTEELSQWRK